MKIRVNKDFAKAMGFGTALVAPLSIAVPPLAVAYAIFVVGFVLHDPKETETVEIEINPLGGMQHEAARLQYEDYIHGLKQAALYGMPAYKERAIAILHALGMNCL